MANSTRSAVVLVQMPYSGVDRPSIALGLLKAYLSAAGIPSEVVYGNLAFASEIGVDVYQAFEETPPDAAVMAGRMLDQPRLPWLVATRGDDVVGYAYASRHRARRAYRWSVEVSVYLREREQGRGTGRALYAELLGEVRSLGYAMALADITLPNASSVRLHEAMGFQPIGVFSSVGYKFVGQRSGE